MCGIAALLSKNAIPSARLGRIVDEMATRGPDDRGFLSWKGTGAPVVSHGPGEGWGRVQFGHLRLSIIDLNPRSAQPMTYGDGRYHIAFNGEVYNYKELRNELVAAGHVFRTESDTEVVMAAFAQWGEACLTRLVGMFAFVLLDIETDVITVARDPFGIKPLYWTRWDEGLAFASEPLPLLNLPGVSREIAPQPVYDYLLFHHLDSGAETMLADVHRVPAGSVMRIPLGTLEPETPRTYWQPTVATQRDITFEQAADEYRELFLESVRLHMRADIPVGLALSGGLDSASIACAVRHLFPRQEIHAFTYVSADPRLSEEKYVDRLTADLNLTCHKIHLSSSDLVDSLDGLITLQGEPFSTSTIMAQHRVFGAAKDAGIKVLLEGQGADEIMAGYPFYSGSRAGSLLCEGKLPAALKAISGNSVARRHLAQHFARTAFGTRNGPGSAAIRFFGRSGLSPVWLNRQAVIAAGIVEGPPAVVPLSTRTLAAELGRTVTEQPLQSLLRFGDRNSMAHSVENRVPFLTTALADHVLSLPEDYLLGADGTTKRVMRAAMRGLVPDYILNRRDKIGFVTPEADWLAALAPRVRAALDTDLPAFLDKDAVWTFYSAIAEKRAPYHSSVWRLINFVLWQAQIIRST
ncbi:asparagine synthase (glutamine-hydrolyzing) [uncultured Brevundimonas sp.]|uniref:asparagine synthase (glutamine-hydrolyzing) n=1 Tax=uncultured Brevundimonas sp. TaxID=213418 RepID=UPI0030EF9D86|tara:strand:+ start:374 stop:2281 length:1908 start_codon:yes stop_codon:yes gene_type:complete